MLFKIQFFYEKNDPDAVLFWHLIF